MAFSDGLYRDIGIKLTPQRLAILDFLNGNRQHPSADDVFRAVRRRFPTMSLATVYNTLDTLTRHGKVTPLTGDPGRKRFDPNTEPHDHIICRDCGRIVDVPTQRSITVGNRFRAGFEITGAHVEFTGICPDCRKRSIDR